MKRQTGMLWALAILALVFGGTALASQTAPSRQRTAAAGSKAAAPKAPAARESTGTITSIDATRLVIARTVKGKNEQTSFVLTPETKREGDLTAGHKVSVKYHMENSDSVATLVRGPSASAKAKNPATGKKS